MGKSNFSSRSRLWSEGVDVGETTSIGPFEDWFVFIRQGSETNL